MGSSPSRVKPSTIKLVFAASLINTQHKGARSKTCWLGVTIMCLGVTIMCLGVTIMCLGVTIMCLGGANLIKIRRLWHLLFSLAIH